MSGREPSDALRVVNALLTQLDKLKHRKNCLVMTTSNLSAAIDGAFIDRADIKQYIGLYVDSVYHQICTYSCEQTSTTSDLLDPSILSQGNDSRWINRCYCSSLPPRAVSPSKLTIVQQNLLDWKTLEIIRSSSSENEVSSDDVECSSLLYDLAHSCKVSLDFSQLIDW